jgi:hypothetical protein
MIQYQQILKQITCKFMTATIPILELDRSDMTCRTKMERWVIIYFEITAGGIVSR